MVKIRLRRDGAKKRPFYHIVAADVRRARDGRFIAKKRALTSMDVLGTPPSRGGHFWAGAGPTWSATTTHLCQRLLARRLTVSALPSAHLRWSRRRRRHATRQADLTPQPP